MAEYLSPGVYIEEIERGPKPIEGVSTSTAAFLGRTERGNTQPQLVTSFNRYRQLFGNVFETGEFMPQAVSTFFDNGGVRCYICRIVGQNSSVGSLDLGDLRVSANGPGAWSARVYIKVDASSTKTMVNGTLTPVGIKLQIAYWSVKPEKEEDPFGTDPLLYPPTQVEQFDDLVLDNARSPNYFLKRVPNNSGLITLGTKDDLQGKPPQLPNLPTTGWLGAGADGDAVSSADYNLVVADPSKRMGLQALLLDQYRDVALVYAPNADDALITAITAHCERQRFRFAVFDSPSGISDASNLDPRSKNHDTSYGAFYYPWITIADPQSGAPLLMPPGGAVLGIYARSDNQRGVFKAPANEIVNDATDLEYYIDGGTQDVLNPRGVNVIRQFPGRGIRVWGARTLSSDALWKYVPVRRLFIFLEHSIFDGTQWVVFEPNDERLWARVKDSIRVFLRGQWRDGALMGTTEAEAFSIACDRTTMTDDDILNGKLICEIGVAPVRPAEFVIFRIFQMTVEAKT